MPSQPESPPPFSVPAHPLIDRTITELRQLRTGLTRTRRDAADHTPATGGVCRIIEHAPPTAEK